MIPDLSTWLTSSQTAKQLGVKYRTVLDMVSRGQLHPRKISRQGVAGAAVSMFDPAEVEDLVSQRAAARTEIAPASDPGPVIHSSVNSSVNAVVKKPVYQPVYQPAVTLPIDRKLYLNLGEAAEYTGLGKGYIRKYIPGRKIGRNNSLVWRRADLECL